MRRLATLSLVLLFLSLPLLAALLACGGRAAESSPQAAAYRAYVQAVTSANVATWKSLVTANHLDMMKMWCDELKKGTPEQYVANFPVVTDDLHFTGLAVNGNNATLRITGKRKAGKNVKGEIVLALESGAWKIAAESYDN